MKSVCITGVAGFIGSHLAKRQIELGNYVFGVDDFSSSNKNSTHLKNLRDNKSFEFHEISIENTDAIMSATRTRDFDLILNFACPASPPRYQSIPVKTLNTCFIGTRNMLQIARMQHAKLIHASTSEIYGDPLKSPQIESDWGNVNCFGPRSMYDEGKRVAETLCREFQQIGTDVRVIRIFNTYGPNMDKDDGRVVTNFLKQAMNGEDITIYGDGTQTRSFCYIDDLVRGIELLANLGYNPGSPINLGNDREFTMLELAEVVTKMFDNGSKIVFKPLPGDDPRQRKPNLTRANEILGWKPEVSLEQGLIKMKSLVEWRSK